MADGLFNPSRLYEALKQYGLLPKHANYSPAGDANGLFSAELNRVVAPDASLVGNIADMPLPTCSLIAVTTASGEWPVIEPVSPKQKSI